MTKREVHEKKIIQKKEYQNIAKIRVIRVNPGYPRLIRVHFPGYPHLILVILLNPGYPP